MTDVALYARLNRRQTHVVCVDTVCGGRFATVECAQAAFAAPVMEVLGQVVSYRQFAAGEAYVQMMSGFMADTDDDVYRVSGPRRKRWRKQGLPPQWCFARGEQRAIPNLPAFAECVECQRVQVLDADKLGIAPHD